MAERIEDLQFEGLKIIQDPNGYLFTSDSVLLANYVRFLPKSKVVEFCAGSGVISILLSKKQKPSKIHAFEIMKAPFLLMQKSVKLNNLEDMVVPVNEDLKNASNLLGRGYADVVVCNPPYIAKDNAVHQEITVKNVAVNELLVSFEEVVSSAEKLLKFGGKFFLVHRVDRLVDVFSVLRKYKIEPKKLNIIYPKEDFEPVVFLLEAHKGGKTGLRVEAKTLASKLNKA
ncbi:MAG: methyltransferase [Clostridia bacterium]|nr:methyltransferase [Clostridia bacterium]